MKSSKKVSCVLGLLVQMSFADVSHFFAPDFGFFQHHIPQYPFQIAVQQPPPQPSLPSLYAVPPPQQQPPAAGYPDPVEQPVTHAPVAPLPSTTEFLLPEVIENRSAKDKVHFIPLQNQYLPPEERPNYESPRPPHTGYLPPAAAMQIYNTKRKTQHFSGYSDGAFNGYYYPRPTAASTTTSTERPRPIVVVEPPEFVPPIQHEPFVPPLNEGYDYQAPPPLVVVPSKPSTPAPVYLPPGSGDDSALIIAQTADNGQLRLRVQEMRCLQHTAGYFRSVLRVESFVSAAPNVDNDSNDKRCELKLQRSFVIIDIAEEDFQQCGVHDCGKDLCLRLRFPAIRGMRTGSDAILTLHCKTQDRIAVKTHALKMGVANDIQARNVGTYAHGGSQNAFRTHVELLRKSGNGFTRHLESNGAVQLGEELLLRAHVLAGDGWNYTKLTDVSLQRVSPSGELLNNANLITQRGCINPSMQSICTHAPTFDPPLGHRLAFKAVMFQGMRSGDELVMSMRITGCLQHEDCHISTQECNDANLGRRKRNTSARNVLQSKMTAKKEIKAESSVNGTEMSEVSRISFRVIMPTDRDVAGSADIGSENNVEDSKVEVVPNPLKMASAVGFVLLVTCLGIFATLKLKR